MIKVASLRYGVVFKKAFCDPEVFTGFIRDALGIKLEIDHVETEKTFDPPIGKVRPRFDLFAEDVKNRVIVDVQHARFGDHYHRFLHYHCVALLEQIASSQDYQPKLEVYTVVVLTSGDRHQNDISVIDFDPKDLSGSPLGEILHKVMYLCPKYVNDNTPEPLRQWMLAILDSLDDEVEETNYDIPEILKALMHIEKDKVSPDEMAKMKDEYSIDLLKQEGYKEGMDKGMAKGLKEGMDKGMAKGLKEGVDKGMAKGLKEGIDKGLQEGARQQSAEIAKKMLNNGMEISLISSITGLMEEEILKL